MNRYATILATTIVVIAAVFGTLRITKGQNDACSRTACVFLPLIIRDTRGEAPEPTEPVDGQSPTASTTPTSSPTTTATPLSLPTATASPPPLATMTPTSTSTPTTTPILDIINADFEQGPVGWDAIPSEGQTIITNDLPAGLAAHSGDWVARIPSQTSEFEALSQVVTVPFDKPFLSFWYRVISEETICGHISGEDLQDNAFIFVQESDGSYNGIDYQSLCNRSEISDWLQWVVDLRRYAGQEVGIIIAVDLNETLPSTLFVDDVTFQADGDDGVHNGDFEAGVNRWIEKTASGIPVIRTDLPDNIQPHNGTWVAWLNSANGSEIASGVVSTAILQHLTIPSEQPVLSLWYRIDSEETNCFTDFAMVSIAPVDANNDLIEDEAVVLSTFQLCQDTENEWQQSKVTIAPEYLGKRFALMILVAEQLNDQHSSFFVDDITFQPITSDARDLTSFISTTNQQGSARTGAPDDTGWFQPNETYLDHITELLRKNSGLRRLP